MNDKEKLRRLNHLMGNNYLNPEYFESWKQRTLEEGKKGVFKFQYEKHNSHMEIYSLATSLGISDSDLKIIWFKAWIARYKLKQEYNKKPQKEGRDNKDVHVGGGGSNRCMVRYPSKKRSIRTWKKFYNLFPYYAVLDGWDGKTSKRMK